MTLWPWELTALEWLGPRPIGELGRRGVERISDLDPSPYSRPLPTPRESFENVWAQFSENDLIVWDAARGGRIVGSFFGGPQLQVLEPPYRGTGLATRLRAERLRRFGRDELEYLRHLDDPVNAAGLALVRTVHRRAVVDACARGIQVAQRVLSSDAQWEVFMATRKTEKRTGAAAPASTLTGRERLAQWRRDRLVERERRNRYAGIPIGRGLVEKLRAFARDNAEALKLLDRFERLVLVEPDEREPEKTAGGEG